MSRNFPDFLTAYLEYAADSFCPEKFHYWTGISVLAGALERKVWVVRQNFNLYPNLYILLLSFPGMGKSSAGNIGVNEFLSQLESDAGKISLLGTQQSQAAFIQQMQYFKEFYVGKKQHTHASHFFYASEGSNALNEIAGGGSIISTLTDFYDCPPFWKKVLMKVETPIHNACCNLLACATFSFLEQLVPRKEAEGGFASRLLYVVQDEVVIREPKWAHEKRDKDMKEKLLSDLRQIYLLSGPFTPSAAFIAHYEEWFPKQDAYTQGLKSERMQRFLARKHTNVLKLAMICSVSEGDSMTLELRHWERAMELMNEVEAKLPRVVNHSINKESQHGINYTIMKTLETSGGIQEHNSLLRALIQGGADTARFEFVLSQMAACHLISVEFGTGGRRRYKLLADPNDYL